MILYLSGPMTGLPNNNYKEFNKWAHFFRQRGHQVLNPAENDGGSQDKSRAFYMRLDVESLLQVQGIILLQGWEMSKGVKFELAVAHELEIPVYDVETFKMGSLRQMKFDITLTVFNQK